MRYRGWTDSKGIYVVETLQSCRQKQSKGRVTIGFDRVKTKRLGFVSRIGAVSAQEMAGYEY